MNTKHIVTITDCVDVAANELRANLVSFLREENNIVIEPFVAVKEFSVVNCNFVVRLMAEAYPPGTIFLVVFNPCQNRPKSIIGKTDKNDFIFMGRNTGAFDWLTRDLGCKELYDASELFTKFNPHFVSFSGKFVTAPTVAQISKSDNLSSFGRPIISDEIKRLSLEDHTIVHIDNFGMMKFTGGLNNPEENKWYKIELNTHTFEAIFCRRMMSQETGRWVLFPGSSMGMYELGRVREYGAQAIGARIGDVLKITKIK